MDFIGFLSSVECIVLQTEFDEMLEVMRGRITGARFPADDGLARDAEEFRQARLGQMACSAKREDLLTEILVVLAIRRLAHDSSSGK